MNITRLALAGLLVACAFPLRAQVAARTAGTTVAPAEKPEPTCPCDSSNFKPLNDKARAVAEYWAARRKYKVAGAVAGTAALFGIIARDAGTISEAQTALSNARAELFAARTKAASLEGIKVTDGDDKTVEIKLKKGVDYTITP